MISLDLELRLCEKLRRLQTPTFSLSIHLKNRTKLSYRSAQTCGHRECILSIAMIHSVCCSACGFPSSPVVLNERTSCSECVCPYCEVCRCVAIGYRLLW